MAIDVVTYCFIKIHIKSERRVPYRYSCISTLGKQMAERYIIRLDIYFQIFNYM